MKNKAKGMLMNAATGIRIKSIPIILIIIGVYLPEFKDINQKKPMNNYNICK